MQRIKKAYAESGDLKIIPETPPLDGSENWEQGRGAYYELDNDSNTGDPLALDIDREQDNYFKNVISKNIKHWQENAYPNWFNDIEYPKNATVKYTDGNTYVSKVDNNTYLPTNATNWTIYNPSSLDRQFVKLTENQTITGVKTFSSNIAGSITGNSATATKLQTARTINGVAFDGSANITVSDATAVKLTGNQTIAGEKTFSGLSKTSIGDNALEVITSSSNNAAGSFMVSQGAKYGLTLNGNGTGLVTGSFIFQVFDRNLKTVQNSPFNIGINGVVSYNFFPVTPSLAPTENYQVANKKYVDDNTLLSPNDSRVKTALNASGTAPIYACRAWVNFNGTGTVAIRASGNVSSITDNGVGNYTCNLITAMQDVNYCVNGSPIGNTAGIAFFISNDQSRPNTTSSFSVNVRDSANATNDITHINLALIR